MKAFFHLLLLFCIPLYPLSRWKKNVSLSCRLRDAASRSRRASSCAWIGSVHCRGALLTLLCVLTLAAPLFLTVSFRIQSRIPPFSYPIPSELDSAVLNHRRHKLFSGFTSQPFPVLGVLYHLQAEFRSYCKNFQLLPVRILDTSFYFLLPPNDSFHPFPHSFLAFETHLTNVHFFTQPELYFLFPMPSCQNATALAAATLSESTPCDIGIFTV